MCEGACVFAGSTTRSTMSGAVERLRLQVDPPDLELVGEQDLVDDAGQPVGLVDDEQMKRSRPASSSAKSWRRNV